MREDRFYVYYTLSQCVTETNRPPNNAVFEDYVLMEDDRSVIPFSAINEGGTNYWDVVRTFATNIINIAKREGDDDKVRQAVVSIIDDPQEYLKFPIRIQRQFLLYEWFFYDGGKRRLRK